MDVCTCKCRPQSAEWFRGQTRMFALCLPFTVRQNGLRAIGRVLPKRVATRAETRVSPNICPAAVEATEAAARSFASARRSDREPPASARRESDTISGLGQAPCRCHGEQLRHRARAWASSQFDWHEGL